MRSLPEHVQIAIVGAGPAGLAAGVQAASRGVSHAVLERSRLADTVHRYQRGKFVMDEPPRLGLQAELDVGFRAGTREAVLETWETDTRRSGALFYEGPAYEVVAIEGEAGAFRISLKGSQQLAAESVVLALGVQGNRRTFGVQGDHLPHVTYQLDDPAEHVGDRIVIVGVGDAGIENALALVEHGNDVVLVNRRAEIDRAKPRNQSLVEAAIRSREITYLTNTVTEGFEKGAILLRGDDGPLRLEVDRVIGRLGAVPPRRLLESFGVRFPAEEAGSVPEVSESYESSVAGIHVIGALAGYPLIKNCMNQGFEVVEHILGHPVTPSDETILAEKFAGLEGSVSEILDRVRARVPVLRGLNRVQLRELVFESQVRRFIAGEGVFERNEFSNSFFSLLEGRIGMELPATDGDADSDRLESRTRLVEFEAGDFFGEAGLHSGRRRTGRAFAIHNSVVLESPRVVMNRLIRTVENARRVVDQTSIARTVENLVPNSDAAERLDAAASAEVRRYGSGEVLFREGDEPDGVHWIRRGAVTVSVDIEGRDAVIQYVQTGNYVGETALLEPGRLRSATVTATHPTETVLLPTHAVTRLLDRNPGLREEFQQRESEQTISMPSRASHGTRDIVGFLLEQGAYEATDLLLIDESLCIRCDNCEKACAETHGGITRLDREAGPTYTDARGVQLHIPTACQHCEHPKCMDDCPPDALRRHPQGEVYIMDNCIGCGNCVSNCPYDVIQLSSVGPYEPRGLLMRLLFGDRPVEPESDEGASQEIATKCDLCRNLPKARHASSAVACVSACPTGAIVRVDPRAFVDEIHRRQS